MQNVVGFSSANFPPQLIGPKTPGCLLLVPKSLSQKHENVVAELLEFIWKDEGLNKSAVESRHMLNEMDGYILIVRFKVGFTSDGK